MKRVVVTGLGFISSIGNDCSEVLDSLRSCRTGISYCEEFERPGFPVRLAGLIKGFRFPDLDYEDWVYPDCYSIRREELRSMSPNIVYAYCAMQQAIADARLGPELVSNPRTGAMCASGGSTWLTYEYLEMMLTKGVMRCNPLAMPASIAGSLNFNLVAAFRIKGNSLGFSSACASSAHALGGAFDRIRLGRQDVVFAVGAEDCNLLSIMPFAGGRALSTQTDPARSPCAFDRKRDGFVSTGGATVLVLEELEHAQRRGVPIYAEMLGWGESSDGYSVMMPEPNGEGLARAMALAVAESGIAPTDVDYINAHATSTVAGDIAEARAIERVFGRGDGPLVSSTKSITGHGLSLAGAMEAAFCCLALKERFIPVSANIDELDPECAGISVVTAPTDAAPRVALSNSSGFGGANVSVIFRNWNSA
jgi:3-oxoacyl-[acyl-carrier-protein] synthase-1